MIRYAVFFFLLCLINTGCALHQPSSSSSPVNDADRDLVERVNQRLASDPITARVDFGVQSSDSVVTIYGQMDSAAAEMRAISIVRGTPGVRAVINKIRRF